MEEEAGVSRREMVAGAAALIGAASVSGAAAATRTDPLDTHDAMGLAELVRRKQVTASELLEAAIGRAEVLNPRFNFLAQKHYDYGRAAIANGLPQGPFSGVPWLLKDLNTYVAGLPTENGSRFFRGYRPAVTSELVKRIEKAGFVIFGKTTVPELGLTGTTENKLTGDTRNPWNPAHITGGSSGGAAAAVAAGVLPAAHARRWRVDPHSGLLLRAVRAEAQPGTRAHGAAAHGRVGRAVCPSCRDPQRARFRRDPRCNARAGAG